MRILVLFSALIWAAPLWAADIVFLGEQHDNPDHHARQAQRVAALAPRAVVWEMLTPEQADRVTPELRVDPVALEAALGWAEAGWPDFTWYYPIFQAAPEAQIVGAAVPREAARSAMADVAGTFGAEAAIYGLDAPLPEAQQADRLALQRAAHCGALPEEMLPMMVDVQRLRDATLARAALTALRQTGGPVAVITGNGHARTDWGAPAALRLAAPDVSVVALGQGETGPAGNAAPEGTFDEIAYSPEAPRDDPCAAFAKPDD